MAIPLTCTSTWILCPIGTKDVFIIPGFSFLLFLRWKLVTRLKVRLSNITVHFLHLNPTGCSPSTTHVTLKLPWSPKRLWSSPVLKLQFIRMLQCSHHLIPCFSYLMWSKGRKHLVRINWSLWQQQITFNCWKHGVTWKAASVFVHDKLIAYWLIFFLIDFSLLPSTCICCATCFHIFYLAWTITHMPSVSFGIFPC